MRAFISEYIPAEKIKLLFFSGVSAFVKLIVGFVTIKLYAIFIGPEGLALTGNISNLITLLTSIASLGISSGVVKYVAEFKSDTNRLKSIISTGFRVIVIASLSTMLVVLIFSSILSNKTLYSTDYYGIMLLLGFSLPLTMLNIFISNILNGHKSLDKLMQVNVALGLFTLLFITSFVWLWGLKGAFLAIILSPAVSIVFTVYIVRNEYWFTRTFFFSGFDIRSFKSFMTFSFMAAVSALLIPFSQFFIRDLIVTRLSMSAAGEWEAINRMSNAYLSVITATLSVYYLPRLSEIKIRTELLREIKLMASLVLPLLFLLQLFIYLFRDKIVCLLFSSEFVTIQSLFLSQLVGDFFRVASWILAYLIIARAMIKTYIVTEVLSALCYLLFAYLLIQYDGLHGVIVAYVVDFIFYFLLLFFLFSIFYSKGKFI